MAFLRKIGENWYTLESYRDERGKPRQRTIKRHGKVKPPKYKSGDAIGEKVNAIASKITEKQLQFPNKQFEAVLLDPPWQYKLRSNDKTHRNRIPYPPMSLGEIASLPIPELTKPNSYLFLWVTKDYLPEGFDLFQRWGFEYKQIITWVKVQKRDNTKIKLLTGHYLRNSSEFCLIGVKGKPGTLMSKGLTAIPNVIHAPIGQHSEKPKNVHQFIETFIDQESRLELFAREKRDGWYQWGGELE